MKATTIRQPSIIEEKDAIDKEVPVGTIIITSSGDKLEVVEETSAGKGCLECAYSKHRVKEGSCWWGVPICSYGMRSDNKNVKFKKLN